MSRTIGLHQPSFCPSLSYFDKARKCDEFIFYDTAELSKQSFTVRNKILTQQGNVKWLTVPVKRECFRKPIFLAELADTGFKEKHWESIKFNYRNAPALIEHENRLEMIYSSKTNSLSFFNVLFLAYFFECFGIDCKIKFASELHWDESPSDDATDKIIAFVREVNGTAYLSGVGGRKYLDETKFKEAGIELLYQEFEHPVYEQCNSPDKFVPWLSALDALLNGFSFE